MADVKKFMTRNRPGGPLIELYYEGGGELPPSLTGAYTTSGVALKASEEYIKTRRPRPKSKVTKDGEDSSK